MMSNAWKDNNVLKKFHENEDDDMPYIFYAIFKLDENGDELDSLAFSSEDLNACIDVAEAQPFPTHIVAIPSIDPDRDPDAAEYFNHYSGPDPYEVVWESDSSARRF